jgi:nitric oxide synthase oxygenase domain/subunit
MSGSEKQVQGETGGAAGEGPGIAGWTRITRASGTLIEERWNQGRKHAKQVDCNTLRKYTFGEDKTLLELEVGGGIINVVRNRP